MFKTLGFHFIVRLAYLYMQLTICLANKLDLFVLKLIYLALPWSMALKMRARLPKLNHMFWHQALCP